MQQARPRPLSSALANTLSLLLIEKKSNIRNPMLSTLRNNNIPPRTHIILVGIFIPLTNPAHCLRQSYGHFASASSFSGLVVVAKPACSPSRLVEGDSEMLPSALLLAASSAPARLLPRTLTRGGNRRQQEAALPPGGDHMQLRQFSIGTYDNCINIKL